MTTWTVCPDAAMLERAERDLRRALILQNARFAHRADPVSRFRTHRSEARLRMLGLGVAVVGAALAALLLFGSWAATGVVRGLHVVLLAVFAALVPLFVFLPWLRAAGIRALDGHLTRRAAKACGAWREGVARTYELHTKSLVSRVGGQPARSRSLEGLRYALLGEEALMLFRSPHAQTPRLIVLVGTESEQVVRALGNVRTERLGPALLPQSTLERAF